LRKDQDGAPGKLRPAVFALIPSQDRCLEASPKQSVLKTKTLGTGGCLACAQLTEGLVPSASEPAPVAAVFGSSPGARLPRESISLYAKEANAGAFGHILTWLNNPRFGHVVKWLDRQYTQFPISDKTRKTRGKTRDGEYPGQYTQSHLQNSAGAECGWQGTAHGGAWTGRNRGQAGRIKHFPRCWRHSSSVTSDPSQDFERSVPGSGSQP
jgi:hypothetical protein